MFRKRRNSQKPDECFYMDFKHSHGQRMGRQQPSAVASDSGSSPRAHSRQSQRSHGQAQQHGFQERDAQGFTIDPHNESGQLEYTHQPEQGFRNQTLPSDWKTRPSPAGDLLSTFKDITNPAMWTPTPTGGISTNHLHLDSSHHANPIASLGLETPRSASISAFDASQHHSAHYLHDQGHYLDPGHHFSHQAQNQTFFAPHAFDHFSYSTNPDFLSFPPQHGPMGSGSMNPGDLSKDQLSHSVMPSSSTAKTPEDVAPYVKKEFDRQGFRFKAVLHDAPTALIQQQGEKPVAYLNKSQKYRLQVSDLHHQPGSMMNTTYRTWVRVTFDDEQQRERPEASWQLWKEGRGMKEAHEHEGLLRAIEYTDPREVHPDDRYINVQFRDFRFDGFYIDWTPREDTGSAECWVYVRFNFLSTDFSHSKGVKGIPVRLCTRTEVLNNDGNSSHSLELSYCKIKLFRDHGAERKLSNDKAHVRKLRDKFRQQRINQKLSKEKKRKRSSSVDRANKAAKLDRRGSASSNSDPELRSLPDTGDEDKEKAFEMQLESSHTTNYLYLRGDSLDDPEVSPVRLSMEFDMPSPTARVPSLTTQNTSKSDTTPNSFAGPSSQPMSSAPRAHSHGNLQESAAVYPTPSGLPQGFASSWTPQHEIKYESGMHQQSGNPQHLATPDAPIKVARTGSGLSDNYIEAVGVSDTYQPPPPRLPPPQACFYVRPSQPLAMASEPYYLAVYLKTRTLSSFLASLAPKCGVPAARISRVARVLGNGLRVKVDDDVVQQMPEGQDMLADFERIDDDDNDDAERWALMLRY